MFQAVVFLKNVDEIQIDQNTALLVELMIFITRSEDRKSVQVTAY